MPPLDSLIDDLYKGPLDSFVGSRAALVKTVSGKDATRIKALKKPTLVPWAVNQVYWHSRRIYDHLINAGKALRAAQLAALKGRAGDVREATDRHRQALADAVAEALARAEEAGKHPSGDELAKTFSAISLAREQPDAPGRLTRPLEPAGFEALEGAAIKRGAAHRPTLVSTPPAARPTHADTLRTVHQHPTAEADRKRREREQKAAARRHRAASARHLKAINKAQAAVQRARIRADKARHDWERAAEVLEQAERTLTELRARRVD